MNDDDEGRTDLLYPECPVCGLREGISKAILGPESRDGWHDVDRLELACGHETNGDDRRISAGAVDLIRISRPDVIEVRA